MFGYVTPYKSELKIREYNLFKSYYCGLCKTLGRNYNSLVRLGLNYDLSFLSLLLSSLEKKEDQVNLERCITHPLTKRMIVEENRSLKYAADMSIILIYFKLRDDWHDEKSFKALISNIPFKLSLEKAKKSRTEKYKAIKDNLSELSDLEKGNCEEIDELADKFAKIMEEISCPEFIKDEDTRRILKFLGYNLGRWIYILDAFDDIEEDIKYKNYNPLVLQHSYVEGESEEDFIARIKDSIEFTLTLTLENISKSFELLNIFDNKELLENIIYLGMRNKMDLVLYKGGKKFEKSI